ncbi:SHOCT domain-containing protein [Nocardia sp. NPDC047038]|uniref:SHOCT domain-containing protein n=1 Tax=Nocardia sp. NPDC047038 TaxID=3154338 RepID=UPI0033F6AB0C
MPGLLRGVARTAVVAGTATAVSNRVSRRQGERWAAQEQSQYDPYAQQQQQYAQQQYAQQPAAPQPAPAPPSGGGAGMDRITALKELAELKAQGVLTEAEFEAEKARILAS